MTRFLKNPNIPEQNIKGILLNPLVNPEIRDNLCAMGLTIYHACHPLYLSPGVAGHPDLSIHHLGGDDFVVAYEALGHYQSILPDDARLIPGKLGLNPQYPRDIQFNAARIGKYVFHNLKYMDPVLLKCCEEKHLTKVNVRQGYTKCSVCILNTQAIITSDSGIEEKALRYHIDVLKIPYGYIKLRHYAYGFIGGATGLLAPDLLAITGFIPNQKIAEDIKAFCSNHHISIERLSNQPAEDIGSILPIHY